MRQNLLQLLLADEKTKRQRGYATYLRSHSYQVEELRHSGSSTLTLLPLMVAVGSLLLPIPCCKASEAGQLLMMI